VRGQGGFTLVEMLVSLALTAVSASLLVAGLTGARGSWNRAERVATGGERIAAAQDSLRSRIETALPTLRLDGSSPYVDLRGEAQVLSFDAPAAGSDNGGPPRRFRLAIGRSGTVALLDADPLSTLINPAAPSNRGWRAGPLVERAASLDIAYFGAAPPDNIRRWRNVWIDRPALPELVRVRVGFAAGDRRSWPDLVVAPAATVTAACIRDPASGRCRVGAA